MQGITRNCFPVLRLLSVFTLLAAACSSESDGTRSRFERTELRLAAKTSEICSNREGFPPAAKPVLGVDARQRTTPEGKKDYKEKSLAKGGLKWHPPAANPIDKRSVEFDVEDAKLKASFGADTNGYGTARARLKQRMLGGT